MKFFFFLSLLFIVFNTNAQIEFADKIYMNARIWTGDKMQPWAKMIAIKGNTILFVGEEYVKFINNNTTIIDVRGKMIVPGFIDNHTHFLSGGYNLGGINLHKAATKEEFIQTIKSFCSLHNDGRWIQGGNWDNEAWGGELPRKAWIDSVTGNIPLFVSRYDEHMSFANSIVLKMAGIDRNTVAPVGGEIVVDENGEPTGALKDEAQKLVSKLIPDPSEKELDEYLERACQHAVENGVTQVHDMSSYGGDIELDTYRRAYKNNKLPLRVYSFVPIAKWQQLDSFIKVNGKGDDQLRWGGVKGFVDGSLGSTTAWFYQPYLDAPNIIGLQVTDTTILHNLILSADAAGLQVAVHAIGDRANDFILNVFKEAEQVNKGIDHRFRIEHAQHLSKDAITLFGQLQVIPSMQPYSAIDDGKWAYKRLENERLQRTYTFKSLLNANANLTFGSDWSVTPMKPLLGIYAAVTRRTLDNKNPNGWYPAEKISVEEALRCYTANNAFAGFQENKVGILKAGMLADFVVLSDNLFEIPPEKIFDIKVLMTIVNGIEVFKSN